METFSIKDVLSCRFTAMFSTILKHACARRSPVQICREIRPCTETAFLLAVFSGGAFMLHICTPGRWKEWTVNETQASARVQQAHYSAVPSCSDSLRDIYTLNLVLKKDRNCKPGFKIVYHGSVKYLALRVDFICRGFVFPQGTSGRSFIASACPVANSGPYLLNCNSLVVTKGWWSLGA